MRYHAAKEAQKIFDRDAKWLLKIRSNEQLDLGKVVALATKAGKTHLSMDNIASGWIRRRDWNHWAFAEEDFDKNEIAALRHLHRTYAGVSVQELRKAAKVSERRLQEIIDRFYELELVEYGDENVGEFLYKKNRPRTYYATTEEQEAFSNEIVASLKRLGVTGKKKSRKTKTGKKASKQKRKPKDATKRSLTKNMSKKKSTKKR